jgi:hypothetical protein
MPLAGRPTPFQAAIAAITIPGIIFAIGAGTVSQSFWGAVALMTISLPIFWVMLCYAFHELHKRLWGVGISIVIWLGMIGMIWEPANVRGSLSYSVADFGENTDVYGIKWKKEYAEVVLDLTNVGGNDLANIDAYLWVDAQIVATGMSNGINTCIWGNYLPNLIGAASLHVINIQGLSEIPLAQDKWHSPMLHIKCERLSGNNSQIEMVFAVTPKFVPGMIPGQDSAKAHPGWAKLWISVMTNYRPVSWTIAQCFVQEKCGDIPDLFFGRKPSFLSILSHTYGVGSFPF